VNEKGSGRPLSRYLCPSFVMIWISLAKSLELVHDILIYVWGLPQRQCYDSRREEVDTFAVS